MLGLREISEDRDLINQIDWAMTPEKAVSLYLEWGNNWNHGIRMIRSKDDVSFYFVVYYWEEAPVVHLVRRDGEGAEEVAEIQLPEHLGRRFKQHWSGHKGVYALTEDIADWLKDELGASDWVH